MTTTAPTRSDRHATVCRALFLAVPALIATAVAADQHRQPHPGDQLMGADYSAVLVYGLPVEGFTEQVTKYDENTGQPYQVEVDARGRARVTGTTFEVDVDELDSNWNKTDALRLFGHFDYGHSYIGIGWTGNEYGDNPTPILAEAMADIATGVDRLLDEIGAPVEGRGWWLFLDVSI